MLQIDNFVSNFEIALLTAKIEKKDQFTSGILQRTSINIFLFMSSRSCIIIITVASSILLFSNFLLSLPHGIEKALLLHILSLVFCAARVSFFSSELVTSVLFVWLCLQREFLSSRRCEYERESYEIHVTTSF